MKKVIMALAILSSVSVFARGGSEYQPVTRTSQTQVRSSEETTVYCADSRAVLQADVSEDQVQVRCLVPAPVKRVCECKSQGDSYYIEIEGQVAVQLVANVTATVTGAIGGIIGGSSRAQVRTEAQVKADISVKAEALKRQGSCDEIKYYY